MSSVTVLERLSLFRNLCGTKGCYLLGRYKKTDVVIGGGGVALDLEGARGRPQRRDQLTCR